ncbi:MAG: response regulator transcription factor, partial [Bacteroidales bacterium]|nr:response regulator transcription factor [Bacteroidales bacterium]
EQNLAKLKALMDNVYDKVQFKLSLINKNKKAVFVELFAKHIEIENENALIGSLIELSSETKKITSDSSKAEFGKIIDFLVSSGKDKIAEEVINVQEIISFDNEAKKQKMSRRIKLTKRETEIIQLICEGFTNVEIAEKLFISNRTVDNHRANLLAKTGTRNTASLVAFVVTNKLVKM